MNHGLTPRQLAVIKGILRPYADRLVRVDLFGSRATGNWRPNSDIDLALYGRLEEKDVDRLRTLFLESSLPVAVDVKQYERTAYPPLRAHMDAVRQCLFTHAELTKE